MSHVRDIDDILRRWPYEPNSVSVRLVQAADDRDVIQMRIDMGLLQLETEGRPDGKRPQGAETYFDYLLAAALQRGDQFVLSETECAEADREFVQFYHRRICWLALREFRRAVQDADHTLAFMDFCLRHAPSEEWAVSHEQYRPFVLFHRAQAAALGDLEEQGPEESIQQLNQGIEQLRDLFRKLGAEERFADDQLVRQLVEMRESLRERFQVGKTLQERLADAIAREQYELAATIRDQIARRTGGLR